MEIEELRQLAKSKGIKHWHNKKPDNLIKELGIKSMGDKFTKEMNASINESLKDESIIKPKIQITITEVDNKFFTKIGFKADWLASLANQYNFTKFHYVHKFRAFRCYQEGKHVDWISLNDLGLVNVKKELTQTLLKHQPLNKKKQVIKLPWR